MRACRNTRPRLRRELCPCTADRCEWPRVHLAPPEYGPSLDLSNRPRRRREMFVDARSRNPLCLGRNARDLRLDKTFRICPRSLDGANETLVCFVREEAGSIDSARDGITD